MHNYPKPSDNKSLVRGPWGGGQYFCDDSNKTLTIKCVKMGEGVKISSKLFDVIYGQPLVRLSISFAICCRFLRNILRNFLGKFAKDYNPIHNLPETIFLKIPFTNL